MIWHAETLVLTDHCSIINYNYRPLAMKSIIVCCFMLLLLGSLSAQPLSTDQKKAIDAYLDKLIAQDAPGLAVGVVKEGEIIYESYLGLANIAHRIPIDERTRFNIASVAKEFTALCVLQLVLDGKISLEDDIREYLPELYPNVTSPIQIKQMLNHSSGIRDFYDLLSIQQDPWWRKEGLSNADAIALLQKQQELSFEPGTEHLYSNSNYTLLAEIAAKVSGQSFHEYSKALFLQLGMDETGFLKNYMHPIPFQALPYTDWGNGIWQQYPTITNLYGDGFLFTTLRDQLVFEQAVQKATPENRLLTISQQPIENAKISDYGYGLELKDRLNYKAVHHSGGTGSNHAQTIRFPELQLSVFIMSNNGNLWSGNIADEIAGILLPPKKTTNQQIFPAETKEIQAALPLDRLMGTYKSPSGGLIRIFTKEDVLYWQMDNNNEQELIRVKGNLFQWAVNEKIKVAFTIWEDGHSNFTVYYPGAEPKIHQKQSSFVPDSIYLEKLVGKYYNAELDFGFSLEFIAGNQLVLTKNGEPEGQPLKVVQKDDFLLFDYKLRPVYNKMGQVTELLMDFNRVKNIRFINKTTR